MTAEAVRVGVSSLERLEALVANDELFALADAVPEPDPAAGGRPRMFPPYMWVLFDALLSVYGSARRVEVELAHPVVWAHLRALIAGRASAAGRAIWRRSPCGSSICATVWKRNWL